MTTIEGKVLLTGASGFVGSRVRDRLRDQGVDCVTLRRGSSPKSEEGRAVTADYDDIEALEAVFDQERPDVVLHVAGVTKGRTYEEFRRGNVMPTENLIAVAERVRPGLQRFVYVSSLVAYGPSTPTRPHQESDPREPIEFYGQSKLEAEQVVERSQLPWTILRPPAIYGPGDVDHFQLFRLAARGLNPFYGNRKRCMSMIYVDDFVRGIEEAVVSDATVGKGYFVLTEDQVTWEELQAAIVETVGRKTLTIDLPEFVVSMSAAGSELMSRIDGKARLFNLQKAKMGAQEAWTCSGDAARADFGFEGRIRLAEGLRQTHQWYLDNKWY